MTDGGGVVDVDMLMNDVGDAQVCDLDKIVLNFVIPGVLLDWNTSCGEI